MIALPADSGRTPFVPDAARAAVIDRKVRQALAGSLASVFEACSGHLLWRPEDQHGLLATLLGSTLGEPMVGNDPACRYKSPLRADARQMDRLVHASFVLARMMWCQDRLLQSGLLHPEEQREATLARAAVTIIEPRQCMQ